MKKIWVVSMLLFCSGLSWAEMSELDKLELTDKVTDKGVIYDRTRPSVTDSAVLAPDTKKKDLAAPLPKHSPKPENRQEPKKPEKDDPGNYGDERDFKGAAIFGLLGGGLIGLGASLSGIGAIVALAFGALFLLCALDSLLPRRLSMGRFY